MERPSESRRRDVRIRQRRRGENRDASRRRGRIQRAAHGGKLREQGVQRVLRRRQAEEERDGDARGRDQRARRRHAAAGGQGDGLLRAQVAVRAERAGRRGDADAAAERERLDRDGAGRGGRHVVAGSVVHLPVRQAKRGSWRHGVRRGAFFTLVPIRPRPRGERRFLRTSPGASLRPGHGFNPHPRCLSTPPDAFELHPDVRA
eukprot:30967-Pelagococcus_subviridis.AAC.14